MTPQALEALELVIREHVPGFEVLYKDESRLMKFLGQLVRPFNPRFMADFTTTWGNKVYFPTRAFYQANPRESFITLAHEFVHLWDGKQQGVRFKLSYAAPQVLGLVPLLVHAALFSAWPLLTFLCLYYLATFAAKRSIASSWALLGVGIVVATIAAIVFTGWATLLLLLGVILLGPWPSKGRTKCELRGYGMNIAQYTWARGRVVEDIVIEGITHQFTGANYWFMSRDAEAVQSELRAMGTSALENKLIEMPYGVVHDILAKHGFVRPS